MTLNFNTIVAAFTNQIIGIELINADLTQHDLVSKIRKVAAKYGDTMIYRQSDTMPTTQFKSLNNQSTAPDVYSVLKIRYNVRNHEQSRTINKARQVAITLGGFWTSQAFMNEGQFTDYHALLIETFMDGLKVWEDGLIKTFVGILTNGLASNNVEVQLSIIPAGTTAPEMEAANRLSASFIGEAIANIADQLRNIRRGFNNLGYNKQFSLASMQVVWNSAYRNKIRMVDLPTVFHRDGVESKLEGDVLTADYFGSPNTSPGIAVGGEISLVEVNSDGTTNEVLTTAQETANVYRIFIGQPLPAGFNYGVGQIIVQDASIICKMIPLNGIVYLRTAELTGEAYNPADDSSNRFAKVMYCDPSLLDGFPVITFTSDIPSI